MAIPMCEEELTGPGAWRGPELQRQSSWIHELGAGDVAEIESALAGLKRRGITIPFGADDFALPQLGESLRTIPDSLEQGPGVVLVRGLTRDRFSVTDCELIYWGIGVQFGTPISQNTRGHLLGHVRDEGKSFDDPMARGYQTAAKMDFHADQLPVDILGLFCVRPAKSGGASTLVSALTVHNVIRAERPDLLEVLYQPFHLDWRGEEPPGEEPWYQSPMFSFHGGQVTSRFTSRQYFESVTRYDPAFALTPMQREALNFAQEVANRPELRLTMMLREGDMQFLNNHVILHAREAFEDHDDPELKRHLLRMWIACPPGRRRSLSPLLADRYRIVQTGGIPARR